MRLVGLLMLSFFCIPHLIQAQCNCAVGVPATEVTLPFVLPSTNTPTATLTFPQFDPSIGTLRCMTLNYKMQALHIRAVA